MGWRIKAALAAITIAIALPAHAQVEPASPGLPMWIIEDEDSKIYITGTVHLLKDGQHWRSEKLDAAFAEAHELWLEVAEIGDAEALRAIMDQMIVNHGEHDGPSLSSMLSEKENLLLAEARARAGIPDDAAEIMEHQQPWVTILALGRDSFFNDGYKEENGIDNALARMAQERNMPVRGMEDIETQLDLMLDLTVEEQLAELRADLLMAPALRQRMERVADLAFGGWVRGETNAAEALILFNRFSLSYDAIFTERNIAWASVVEDMLAGSGVAFIAVGAGHLVGPDSLQKQLEQRGIASRRF